MNFPLPARLGKCTMVTQGGGRTAGCVEVPQRRVRVAHQPNADVLAEHYGAQLLILPGAGHGVNEQCAVEVNSAISAVMTAGNQRRPLVVRHQP